MTVRHKGLSTQQTLTWSHENRLASLTATGLSESYLYDADGQRVKKVSGSTTTYYPFPHYEVSGSTVTKYYFFNGQRVAMRQNGVLYYLHPDHLGSTAQTTDSSGGIVANQGYQGYGKYRLGGALPTDHRYTGQKLDIDTGLMYYGARYYDRQVGAFISPDTLVPDPTNIWDYNRYGYARLNPMKYNDPTGHCATLEDGSPNWEGKVNYQCWQTAYAIYGYGVAGLAAFQQDWKVAADDWLENIAKQEFATTEYLQPFLNEYNSLFCAQTGLQCGTYIPGPAPQHPIEHLNSGIEQTVQGAYTIVCVNTWDCPAIGLDLASLGLSIAGDAAAACTAVTGPLCGSAAVYIKYADVTVTAAATAYALVQYASGDSSEIDLAVALADTAMSVLPGLGEASGISNLLWDLADPLIPDEKWSGPGVAR